MSEFTEYALKIREMFGQGDRKRDAGLATPADVKRFDDIIYGHEDETMQRLDVYRPKGKSGKLPVILNIHGGGWVYGNKEVYQYYCMSLAQRGFAVVNFTYRLAPEYQYPASFEDTCLVMKWILENKETYGFDTDHLFGVGDSAGGQMLAVLSAAMTSPDFHVPYEIPKDFRFKAVALNCGVYQMEKESLGDTAKLMKVLLPEGGSDQELSQMSASLHISENFPPCFIMTCPGDFLKGEPAHLIPQLMKNSVPFVFRVYGSKDNPLAHVFHCNMRLSEAALCNDEECAFFREFL
jgi:acetyl esterase/lipase